MVDRHVESKVVRITIGYFLPSVREPINVCPITPSKNGHRDAAPSVQTTETEQLPSRSMQLDDDNYLLNPIPENEHVGVDEEDMYLGKERVAGLELIVHGNDDKDYVPEEDSDVDSGSDSGSEFESESEFVEELVAKDSMPGHIRQFAYDKEDPPMTVGIVYQNIAEFKLAFAQHAIKHEFKYNIEKSELDRFRAYCSRKEGNCPWRIHASTMEDEVSIMVMST